MEDFDAWFEKLTGNKPFPYQHRLALSEEWPQIAGIPTGAGKTAAAVLAWLWKRQHGTAGQKANTGRRLVYCLPMRVLVDQTLHVVQGWLRKADSNADIAVHTLMGGAVQTDWVLHPDREAILIGTQDMLLSRALNRGYGSARGRWPQEFALLHNDCLWVVDEVQLMGVGLATTAQLAGFRHEKTVGPAHTLWMSATVQPAWLATVDHPQPAIPFGLEPAEVADKDSVLGRVLHAPKTMAPLGVPRDGKVAAEILKLHQEPLTQGLTLAVCNTVKHAVEVFNELVKLRKASLIPELVLLHSRFRQGDRDAGLHKVLSPVPTGGRIVVSTQVIEAGVDLSASLLVTDLAPWASMIQRLGRLNRKGEYANAKAFWVDVDKNPAPYLATELDQARHYLTQLGEKHHSVAPVDLPPVQEAPPSGHLLRRRDLSDLFDTTPDLAGHDTDVSRYIRENEDHDVQVFWRVLPEGMKNLDEQPEPRREELCPVPIGDFKKWLKGGESSKPAWYWDFLESRWLRARENEVYPGQVFLLSCKDGGYSTTVGWSPSEKDNVGPVPRKAGEDQPEEGTDSDPLSETASWQTIAEHTQQVVDHVQALLRAIQLPDDQASSLTEAARRHDWGKAHPAFQAKIVAEARSAAGHVATLLAKAPGQAWSRKRGGGRSHFRHELASALATLGSGMTDLVSYLVASHHGKVRLSIRSLPEETPPPEAGRRYARGVWEDDTLPETDLGAGITAPETTLRLNYMEMGLDATTGPSWADRMLGLRDELGIFRLAYLESILRAADQRASAGMALGGVKQ